MAVWFSKPSYFKFFRYKYRFSESPIDNHRMRTVAGADKIVVLSDGTVAEQGNSDSLLKKNGIYARMVKLQTQNQNWAME